MTKLKLITMLGLAAIAASVWTCGGGVAPAMDTRDSARDKATKATCDRYQECGLIGTDVGDAYVTYNDCSIAWTANWNGAWSTATCTAINQAGLNMCMSAIAATACNIADLLLTLLKCQEADVCVGTADAGDRS